MKILSLIFCFAFLQFSNELQAQVRTEKNRLNEPQISAAAKSVIKKAEENPLIQKALQMIKDFDEQTLRNQIALTEKPSPPFEEHKFGKAQLFSDLLKECGVDSLWTDKVGNVIGLRKGKERKKVLAIAGHLDTVFPEGTDVKVKQSNDTLYAPGIGDDNRGLAAVLTLLKVMNEANIQTKDDILFIGDVGEEGLGDLRGMKNLFAPGGPHIDAFISVEPGGIRRITNQALGSHRYKVVINGPGGHSWGSFGLANPIHALGQIITIFAERADKFTREGPKTSYNVGRIDGGTSVNSIPFSAWMEVDMRSVSQQSLKEIDTILQQSVREGLRLQNQMKRFGDPVTADVTMVGNRPSGETNPNSDLVQYAMASSLQMGTNPLLEASSTDSNIPVSLGIPAVTLGGGGESGGSHSLHEWYVNKNGVQGIQRLLLMVAAMTGVSNN